MSSIDTWLSAIRERFHEGPPNGWLLGWDQCRFMSEIVGASAGAIVTNYTSFDYSFCNTYEVTPGEHHECHDALTVRISFIVDAFALHWTCTPCKESSARVVATPHTPLALRIEAQIRQALETRGFEAVPAPEHDRPVPGVALELAGDRATLGKCLFDDYEG